MQWILLAIIFIFCGCQQKAHEERYTELASETPTLTQTASSNPSLPMNDPHHGIDMDAMKAMATMTPSSTNPLTWVTPKGWTQTAASPMRLATLKSDDGIECSIIMLNGQAGGVEENLKRWLSQIGSEASKENLDKLQQSQEHTKTKDSLEVRIFDFTRIPSNDKSIIAAMIPMKETIVFVKMFGPLDSVKKNKEKLLRLLTSITIK